MANKEIRYLGRDFANFRENLVNFSKVYFPQTYKNFNESSVGMMFIEMASYVGDVLSYYIDSNLKESLLLYAEEEQNIYALAQSLGYKPQLSTVAQCEIYVYQIVPSTGTGASTSPNYNYALTISNGMEVTSTSGISFRTIDSIDFSFSSSIDPTDVSIFERDGSGNITFYVLRKKANVVSGEIKTTSFTFTNPVKFDKKIISDNNFIDILDVVDSDGNYWYHVPYLAQDTIFIDVKNNSLYNQTLSQYNDTVPYLLKLKKTARRFTTRIRGDKSIELQFGAGVSSDPDELLIPNPSNVGSNVFGSVTFSDNPIDPSNFLHTKTYGQVPYNTTLTVRYISGGGFDSNVNQNSITSVTNMVTSLDESGLNSGLVSRVKNSVAVDNPEAATGGRDGETVDEIRYNAMANYPTQLRAVTKEDYIVRTYSMPEKYGSIAKAYIEQDSQLSKNGDQIPNPLALNLYVLGYNSSNNLTTANRAVKENLKTYLSQYRMLTDAINILDGYVINIGVKFTIVAFKNYNKREVVLKCVNRLKDYFNINKWQINQPIILSELQTEIFSVDGVQSVNNVEITNKWKSSEGYSGNIYDIDLSTKDGVIYPSIDPSIFEVKYPNSDIEGRAL